MSVYSLLRPLIFAMGAESAHRLTIGALKCLPAAARLPDPPRKSQLGMRVAGLDFANPIGLAPGFDKDAEVFGQMMRFGFGFAEVGTLTPRPQPGNPQPRLFRLTEDRAVINRMGFNNRGQDMARPRLADRRRCGIVGVNIGANKDSSDRIADYIQGVRTMAPVADYLTINISSPNTPGLRDLQDKVALNALLAAVTDARGTGGPPLFLKVAPDLEPSDIDDVAKAVLDHKLDAVIVANTTLSRPPLQSRFRGEAGGLSGAPLRDLALQRLKDFRTATGAGIPLISAGGIECGLDAYQSIRAGASLVQIYTALVYQGPGLARTIAQELDQCLDADGFASVREAVGTS